MALIKEANNSPNFTRPRPRQHTGGKQVCPYVDKKRKREEIGKQLKYKRKRSKKATKIKNNN